MKIVSRMIFAQIMKNSLFVLLTLVALFAFFDLIGQSGNIGTSYSMGQAFLLTALILPTRCYEVLPIAVMLGSIFTLSRLASTSQFTVLRVSGIGPWRFCGMLLMPGIVLVICAYLLGKFGCASGSASGKGIQTGYQRLSLYRQRARLRHLGSRRAAQ